MEEELKILNDLPKVFGQYNSSFDIGYFRTIDSKVDVNFHQDGWWCGKIKVVHGTQVTVNFANEGEAPIRLIPISGEIRKCQHRPQLTVPSL